MMEFQFKIPHDNLPLVDPSLPVDVRRRTDNALIKSVVTDRPVLLEPGNYIAEVRFPDGQICFEDFSVVAGIDAVSLPKAASLVEAVKFARKVDTSQWRSDLPLQLIDFNPFSEQLVFDDNPQTYNSVTIIAFPDGDAYRFLPVAPVKSDAKDVASIPIYLIAAPGAERSSIRFESNFDAGGRPLPRFAMKRDASTFLYDYLRSGDVSAATRLSNSVQMIAMELVNDKPRDPVSGALGLYLLLETGFSENLRDPCEKLFRYNPRLADGAILHAEYLANVDRHEEAAKILADALPKRGLPSLSTGFRTALARIYTYISAEMEAESLRPVADILRHWARRANLRSPTTVLELDEEWATRIRSGLKEHSG